MTSSQSTASRANSQRAQLQNPRQPQAAGSGRTRANKSGSQKNPGAKVASSANHPMAQDDFDEEHSMDTSTVPETPTPASRKGGVANDTSAANADGGKPTEAVTEHGIASPGGIEADCASAKNAPHEIPDEIFTPPGPNMSHEEALGPSPRVSSEQQALKSIHFKKLDPNPEEEEPMSATQAMRQVKLDAARAQYNDVKELYEEHLARVAAVEAKSRNGAIDKAMLLSRAYLVELHAEMKANEAALLETLKGSNPEVIFVPHHVDPPVISHKHQSNNQGGPKRKASWERAPPSGKRLKQADVTQYLDIEARESNKESRSDVLGTVSSSRGRIKSRAIVTTSDDEEAEAFANSGVEVHIKDAVDAKKAEAKDKKAKVEKPDDGETMDVDPTCIFHVEKLDLSQLVTDTDAHEIIEIKETRDAISSSQFNWGDVLAIPAVNAIACWHFDSDELKRRPGSSALGPHLNYVRALIADKDMMQLRLQTYPLVTRERLNWDLIKTSAQYPWLKKNAVFKSLLSMCCRTDLKRQWTSHSVIRTNIRNAHAALHDLLSDSYRIVTFDRDHASHIVRTEGDDGVEKSMVSMGGHITWLVNQVDSLDEGEVVNARRVRAIPSSIKALQKKYLNVFLGLNLIYESEVYNGIINKAVSKGTSKKVLASMKSSQKAASVLQQLYNDRNQYTSAGVKSLPGGSKPPPLIASSHPPTANAEPAQAEKAANDKVSAETSRDISNTKKQCLHSLALFLMFGTAGLFHVLPNWKEASMPETATLLHLSSILSDRRYEMCKDEPHPFGARAWNRLDDLMYRSLRRFIDENGRFKPQSRVNWNDMTLYFQEEFSVKKLAPMFMLDLLSETHRPGLSLGLDGRVMHHVEVESVKLYKLNSPAMESFRALWGQTEGPAYPVTDRGASLYPETGVGSRPPANPAIDADGEADVSDENDDDASRDDFESMDE
ncbi:hypothetical protein DFH28DRAFT_940100 [Melampsora americana]|nr:hypothetical protein DFH28DRAFT_940100 [Melampsora americana]